jgi:hypothetical protein
MVQVHGSTFVECAGWRSHRARALLQESGGMWGYNPISLVRLLHGVFMAAA